MRERWVSLTLCNGPRSGSTPRPISLRYSCSGVFADAEGGGSIAELRDQVRFLSQERERLLADLDAERNRVRRLKAANEEVSGRLEAVMVTLKDLMPAVPG